MAYTPYDPLADDNNEANGYASLVELRAYATARGKALPDADPALTILAVQAMDWLEAQADQYKGEQVAEAQPLQWPRSDVYLFNAADPLGPTVIPTQLKNAQAELCLVIAGGTSLWPVSTGLVVKSRKVDVIEREFFAPGVGGGSVDGTPAMPSVDALLKPLLNNDGGWPLVVERL